MIIGEKATSTVAYPGFSIRKREKTLGRSTVSIGVSPSFRHSASGSEYGLTETGARGLAADRRRRTLDEVQPQPLELRVARKNGPRFLGQAERARDLVGVDEPLDLGQCLAACPSLLGAASPGPGADGRDGDEDQADAGHKSRPPEEPGGRGAGLAGEAGLEVLSVIAERYLKRTSAFGSST